MKTLIFTSFTTLLLHSTEATLPTLNFLSVTTECTKSNHVTTEIEFTDQITKAELHNVLVGSCGIDDLVNFSLEAENGSPRIYTLEFDPWACGQNDNRENSDMTSYSSSTEISFEVAINSNGMVLVLGEHVAVVTCSYQNDYVSVIEFNDLGLDYDGAGDVDGDVLSFELVRFVDESYTTSVNESNNPTVIAGNTIHFKLTPNSDSISNEFVYAPSGCSVIDEDSGLSYSLFNISQNNCVDSAINFDLNFEDSDWEINYTAFMFNVDQTSASGYKLVCNVDLCSKTDENSECKKTFDVCGIDYEFEVAQVQLQGRLESEMDFGSGDIDFAEIQDYSDIGARMLTVDDTKNVEVKAVEQAIDFIENAVSKPDIVLTEDDFEVQATNLFDMGVPGISAFLRSVRSQFTDFMTGIYQ